MDFGSRSLPYEGRGYFEPDKYAIADETWQNVFAAANDIISRCIRTPKDGDPSRGSPGWATVRSGDSKVGRIVVGFFSRSSAINDLYGPNGHPLMNGAGNSTREENPGVIDSIETT